MEWMPRRAVRRPTAEHCREAGEGMAWLHQAAEGFPGRRINDLGQVAVNYSTADGRSLSLLLDPSGAITTFDVPGSAFTILLVP